jgi:nitrate reductase alpha subunit
MNFLEYYNKTGDAAEGVMYIVTHFGCNSTPGSLWTPKSWVFDNYPKAYEKYLEICPDAADMNNYTRTYEFTFTPEDLNKSHWPIANCIQEAGYPRVDTLADGTRISYAKRPYGASIIRCILNSQ